MARKKAERRIEDRKTDHNSSLIADNFSNPSRLAIGLNVFYQWQPFFFDENTQSHLNFVEKKIIINPEKLKYQIPSTL